MVASKAMRMVVLSADEMVDRKVVEKVGL